MRILNARLIETSCKRHPDAELALRRWFAITDRAVWANFLDVRKTFPAADPVKLTAGVTVTVFDIRGNVYRLITTVDYRRQVVTLWHFLTHAEYDKQKWKKL
jgi:mRNA interferase HigB